MRVRIRSEGNSGNTHVEVADDTLPIPVWKPLKGVQAVDWHCEVPGKALAKITIRGVEADVEAEAEIDSPLQRLFARTDADHSESAVAVSVWCDGACMRNGQGGPGGWAAIVQGPDGTQELAGRDRSTTNNRMELAAAIGGLRSLSDGTEVSVYSDSRYVTDGASKWLAGWKRRGWKTRDGDVVNRDLWEQLDAEMKRLTVTFRRVRGHKGVPLNERADELAGEQARSFGL